MNYKDKYKKKVGSFYTFDISEDKFKVIKQMAQKTTWRNIRIGLFWGFFFEALIVATPIYENTVRKATLRRLENKLIEEANLREREAKYLEAQILKEQTDKTKKTA